MATGVQKATKRLTLPKGIGKNVLAATVIYLSLGLYLFWAYLPELSGLKCLFIACPVIGAMGCFVLSRRWISSFAGSLLAGAVYGFSPFVLSFTAFHPIACLPAAAVPWLFCQAVFFRHNKLVKKNLHELAGMAVLALLPFAAIGIFFWVLAQPWWVKSPFFPLPKSEHLTLTHLAGFIVPLSTKTMFSIAFYHVSISFIIMGLCMYVAAERFGVLVVVALGFVLAFFDSVTPVSPVVWGLVPVLFFSILAGLGIQGLAWSGTADRKWILLDIVFILFCGILTTLLAIRPDAEMFIQIAAVMYWLSAVLLGALFFIAKASVRWHMLRWTLLLAAVGVDVVYGARYFIDSVL